MNVKAYKAIESSEPKLSNIYGSHLLSIKKQYINRKVFAHINFFLYALFFYFTFDKKLK